MNPDFEEAIIAGGAVIVSSEGMIWRITDSGIVCAFKSCGRTTGPDLDVTMNSVRGRTNPDPTLGASSGGRSTDRSNDGAGVVPFSVHADPLSIRITGLRENGRAADNVGTPGIFPPDRQ